VYAHAQIQKVPGNYNWNTKGVQITKKKIRNFSKNFKNKKRLKKMGPSPGCADSRTLRRFAIGHVVFSLCARKHFYC
jgi:hypothetical protein